MQALKGPSQAHHSPVGNRTVEDTLKEVTSVEVLEDFKRRIKTMEDDLTRKTTGRTDSTSGVKTPPPATRDIHIAPQVRYCDWEHFKNRYSLEDDIPALEVLLSGHDLESEMEDEQMQRFEADRHKRFNMADNKKTGNLVPDSSHPAKRFLTSEMLDTKLFERIRINSFAPFKIFLHFHDKVENELKSLEESLEEGIPEKLPGADQRGMQHEGGDNNGLDEGGPGEAPSTLSKEEYSEIKCYVELVRDQLLPSHVKFEHEKEGRTKVRFAELWSLFRLGDLVFEGNDSNTHHQSVDATHERVATSQISGRRLWKVYMVHNEDIRWTVDGLFPPMMGRPPRRSADDMHQNFRVCAYRIDYDGRRYSAVPRQFSIPPFEGERDVATLAVYPERFQKDANALIRSLADQGKQFQHLMRHARQSIKHEGWTLHHDPAGFRLPEPDASTKIVSEYISSDVIIDFEEAYHRHPIWKPVFSHYHSNTWSPTVKHDLFPCIQWSDSDRTVRMSKVKEVVVEADDVSELEWNKFAKTDKFIVDLESQRELACPSGDLHIDEQRFESRDLALLPARLFVYSFRDRKFVNADLRYLNIPVPPTQPFEELKIPTNHKTMIRSMVRDHFDKKTTQQQVQARGDTYLEQDFIPGKGQGLVMLLHGAPGVGKTATAEAVAYAHKRPLFPITCGDLGIDPHTVEKTLSDVFRLANLWDCVLLLDEAEIFLSQREKRDGSLKRNALVSIFLRTLEYYPGVLFLTTNRVGTLDEALGSRVHMILFFQYLDGEQTMALFEMNMQRSRLIAEQRASVTGGPTLFIKEDEIRIFARSKFEDNQRHGSSVSWWNGRQIRNAFQIATSLAYEDIATQPESVEPRYLGYAHFERVLEAIQNYGEYRQCIKKRTDDESAQLREERRVPNESKPEQRIPFQSQMMGLGSPQQGNPINLNQHQFPAGFSNGMTYTDASRYPGYPGTESMHQTSGGPFGSYERSSVDSAYQSAQGGRGSSSSLPQADPYPLQRSPGHGYNY